VTVSLSLNYPQIVRTLRRAGCVFAEEEARLLLSCTQSDTELRAMVAKRCAGFPLEHVLGWAQFCDLRIELDPGVFVPRRRTEFLVAQAASMLPALGHPLVVDLCCGSGNIGAALHAMHADLELHAVDIDPVAVACARRNLSPAFAQVYGGDLFAPLPTSLAGRVDMIVADAPYVPTAEIAFLPTEAQQHEARVALDGGADGLDLHRRIAAAAWGWLRPGGAVLVEVSSHQAAQSAAIFAAAGITASVEHCRLRDATVVIGAARR
jgi:release factor glutamine methyltransferase